MLEHCKKVIDLIQMQLFLFISGYLFCKGFSKRNFFWLMKNKFKRLLIPFICIAVAWLIPIRLFVKFDSFMNKSFLEIFVFDIILGRNNGHLWYLPCLFLCFLITYLIIKICKCMKYNTHLQIIVLFIASYIANKFFYLMPTNFAGSQIIQSVLIWWLWFVVGFVFSKYEEIVAMIVKQKILIISLFLLLIILHFIGLYPFKNVVSLLFIFVLQSVIPSKTNEIIKKIDNNSFGIYLLHSPLVYITYSSIPNANPIIIIFINFIVFGLVVYYLTKLIKKSKIKFIIGE